jgi:hypothetical protein
MKDVLAIGTRRTNAELVADLVQLGYVDLTKPILDPTYGTGRWWNNVNPLNLTASDLDADKSPIGYSVDFTVTPWPDNTFDSVLFDPPYKLNGVSHGFGNDASYGVGNRKYISIEDRHSLIKQGMTELARVSSRILVVKCQDQVSSGKVQWQTRIFADHGEALGLALVDMLHVNGHRKQPAGTAQIHARRDYSTALVFRKG